MTAATSSVRAPRFAVDGRGEAPWGARTGTGWTVRAACRFDPDAWFNRGVLARAAAHICQRHCPVLPECADLVEKLVAAGEPPVACVMAGARFTAEGRGWRVKASSCRGCLVSADG